MKNPLISIIVPVYNVEKYLRPCLDSILSQTYTNWEVILVDDGSKDNGGHICDEYAQNDNRFIVIHKENEGVSIARQTGLNNAKGEYVIHADPDDWVEQDWIECLYNKIVESNADMVICDFERKYANKVVCYRQQSTSIDNNSILVDLLTGKLWGACWNKLMRKKCFEDYNISFHPEMNLWEDKYVMCLLVLSGIKVDYVPKILYHYDSVINENGIVMHPNNKHIKSVMYFIEELSPILSESLFEDGWYHVKSKVKRLIFLVKDCPYDIKDTYSEINERYIKRSKNSKPWSMQYCIALCLKGHSTIAHLVYNSVYFVKECLQFKNYQLSFMI